MDDLYLYNKGSHTLHINGLCRDAKGKHLIPFSSEDEALKFAGRALGICKTCAQIRDDILKKYVSSIPKSS